MQYDAETPEQYLGMLDDDWRREKLLAIRHKMLAVPGVTEGIGYKMLAYHRGDTVFAHLNASESLCGGLPGRSRKDRPGWRHPTRGQLRKILPQSEESAMPSTLPRP